MEGHRAILLFDGAFELGKEALVVDQPLAADALLAVGDPLLLVVEAVAFQLGELALRLLQLALHLAELARGLALGLERHVHHRGEAFGAAVHGRNLCRALLSPALSLKGEGAKSSEPGSKPINRPCR